MTTSLLEEALSFAIGAVQLPEPVREFVPIGGRKWRVDFAWPQHKLAVEVEGGTWSGGRHTTGKGFQNDCDKYNMMTLAGWKVLRVTGKDVDSGRALLLIEAMFRLIEEGVR